MCTKENPVTCECVWRVEEKHTSMLTGQGLCGERSWLFLISTSTCSHLLSPTATTTTLLSSKFPSSDFPLSQAPWRVCGAASSCFPACHSPFTQLLREPRHAGRITSSAQSSAVLIDIIPSALSPEDCPCSAAFSCSRSRLPSCLCLRF